MRDKKIHIVIAFYYILTKEEKKTNQNKINRKKNSWIYNLLSTSYLFNVNLKKMKKKNYGFFVQ